MEDQQDELNQLHQKVVTGLATPNEKKQLVAWLARLNVERTEISLDELSKDELQSRKSLRTQLDFSEQQVQINKWWISGWARVAAVLLVVGAVSLLLWQSKSTISGEQNAKTVVPGGEKALLTLANGKVVSLSDVTVGTTVALQGHVRVEKTKEGSIVYHANTKATSYVAAKNTLTTPNGGHFKATLPDGTIAWLNAASSISYPLKFAADERRIKMTGEVYFEVAKLTDGKRKRIPFFVETDKQEIQVLGTHFNVNAYTNEDAVRTTLVEGSVKVRANDGQVALLRPGQQTVLAKNLKVQRADIEQQLAWKNGDFIFRGEKLEDVLRQISRWYDIEVECPKHLADVRFTGMVSRSQPISVIKEMIETTKKLKVELKERRFTVTE
ncbi:FecR family protein [Pedobacter helvus]|uniref:FecR family protein n=1 Tax=Pedobacter helvus TaxID=2563444 RepID=A0ABW9JL78_9SPHI|nr:FecR domain-containing protein [Pedobacter ureilyticus]